MGEGILEKIFGINKRKESLTQATQDEAAGRPIIGGGGSDSARQAKLDGELGKDELSPEVKAARDSLAKGTINIEQFDKQAGRK